MKVSWSLKNIKQTAWSEKDLINYDTFSACLERYKGQVLHNTDSYGRLELDIFLDFFFMKKREK